MDILKDKQKRKKVIIAIAVVGVLLLGFLGYALYSTVLGPQTTQKKETGPELAPNQFQITEENLKEGHVEIKGKSYTITLENEKYYLNFPAESIPNVNTYEHPFFGKLEVENNQVTLPNDAIIEGGGSRVIDVVNSRCDLPAFKVFITNANALSS